MNDEWAKVFILPFVYVAAGALAICLGWFFRSRLRQLLIALGIKNLKVAGVEISMSSRELDSAQKKVNGPSLTMAENGELSELAETATPYIVGSRLLWVDDNPLGNIEERRAFRLLGIEVTNCLNTSAAIEHLGLDDYDLVVSDINRGNNFNGTALERTQTDCGWTTLLNIEKINKINLQHNRERIPVIFYHGAPKSEREALDNQARAAGAVGATTSPAILYRWVLFGLLMKVAVRGAGFRHLLYLIPREVRQRLEPSV